MNERIAVAYIYADSPREWNCSEWRCLIPSNALNAAGHRANLFWIDDFASYWRGGLHDRLMEYDLIIVQRNLVFHEIHMACDYFRALGKPVVCDLDDAYNILPWSNPAHAYWIRNVPGIEPPPLEMLEEGLRNHVDALTSPSKVILEDWSHLTKGYWLPNYACGKWYKNLERRPKHDRRILLGWGGSVSHLDSWEFSGALQGVIAVMKRYPNVYFLLCGNDERLAPRFVAAGMPEERLIRQWGVPPQWWPQIIAKMDIGLAPLAQDYDRRRSWIKGIEYLLAGVPWIYTAYEPYEPLAGTGEAVQSNTAEEWEEKLSRMVERLPAYRNRAAELQRMAFKRYTIEERLDDYVRVLRRVTWSGRGKTLPNVLYVGSKWQNLPPSRQPHIGSVVIPGPAGSQSRVSTCLIV